MAADLQEIFGGREVIYAFFAKLFLEPICENEYKMINDILPMLKNLEDISSLAKKEINMLDDFITKYNSLQEKELDEFKLDNLRAYTRIFALTDSVPNSESYYTSLEHLVNQQSREQVLKSYKTFGYDTDFHDSNEPEDFIAYELMFMSYLSKGIAQNIEKGDKKQVNSLLHLQKMFLEEHLLKWVEMFSKSVIGFVESVSFYAPACYFMMGFLKYDFEIVNESLS